jgi:hypothetical protein
MELLTVEEAWKIGPLVEIKMVDQHRGIGAGSQIVIYLGHTKGHMHIMDWFGSKARVPDKLYRFIGVANKETEVKETGEVLVKEDKKWKSLGRLLGENPPKGSKKKATKKKSRKKTKKKATKKKKKARYSGGIF